MVTLFTLSTIYIVGHKLLRVSLPPRGNFVDYCFQKAYHLESFLKHVSPLVAGDFGCYIVLITLPLIKKYAIKAIEVVHEQFKLAN